MHPKKPRQPTPEARLGSLARRGCSGRWAASMRKVVLFCSLVLTTVAGVGCVAHKRVEGGYTLVTTSAGLLNPDAVPGTSLHYRGSRVWPVVFPGYYWPEPASKFYHDGIFVFAGSV